MKHSIQYFLFTVLLLPPALYAQNNIDTTKWITLPCSDLTYTLKYPSNYYLGEYCHSFCKEIFGKDCRIMIWTEIAIKPPEFLLKKLKVETYNDWIEWRTRVQYDADGPSVSVKGESIAKNVSFINKEGVEGNEIYTYVSRTEYLNGNAEKKTSIRGPIFVFKSHHGIFKDDYKNEPAFFFELVEGKADSTDLANLMLIIDTFKLLK